MKPDPAKAKAGEVLQLNIAAIKAQKAALAAAAIGGAGAILTAPVAFPVAIATNWGDGTENIIPDVLREGSQASLIGGGTVLGGVSAAALLHRMRQRR